MPEWDVSKELRSVRGPRKRGRPPHPTRRRLDFDDASKLKTARLVSAALRDASVPSTLHCERHCAGGRMSVSARVNAEDTPPEVALSIVLFQFVVFLSDLIRGTWFGSFGCDAHQRPSRDVGSGSVKPPAQGARCLRARPRYRSSPARVAASQRAPGSPPLPGGPNEEANTFGLDAGLFGCGSPAPRRETRRCP